MRSVRIFLMRHGVTEWNKSFRYQGSSDVPLSDEGRGQAAMLGLRMSCVEPAKVFSSPLVRAYETARIVMGENERDVPIEKMDDLREISFGAWEGKTVSEVLEEDGETLEAWRSSPFGVTPKGGEPIEEVAKRSRRMADFLRKTCVPGEAAFVFGHGAILRSLLAAMLDIGDIGVLWRMRLDNCSVTVVDLWGERPSLYTLNDTNHIRLGREMAARLNFCD